MSTPPPDPWVVRPRRNPQNDSLRQAGLRQSDSLRLFCFPYAGGGALVYRTWPDGLPFGVEVCAVQLPGREKRIMEPPYTRLAPLVQKLALVLIPYLDRPFTFFGHSMGALISFELVRQLRRQYGLGPAHLFVAGHRAPKIPNPGLPIYQLPEADFIARLRCFGGLPEVVLQDAELKDVFVPLLRADIELCETYVYVTGAPFDCHISQK